MDTIKLFGMPAQRGRWLLIPLGIFVLLCLSTVYSWSIFRKPLEKSFNYRRNRKFVAVYSALSRYSPLTI